MGVVAIATVIGVGATTVFAVSTAVVAAVALTATVVGLVTKSPVLTKIGAGLGLASAGAGLIADGASAAGEAGATTAASDTAGAAAAETAPAATAIGAATPGIETVTSTAPALTGASAAGSTVANTASLAAGAANAAQPTDKTNAPPSFTSDIKFQAPTINEPKMPVIPQVQDPTSWFDRALTGIENHKALATSSAQLLGGALGGLGTTYAADKQYDINSQLLDLQKQRLANGSAQPNVNPQYNGTANLYPTTTPVYTGTQAAGIINQQRKPA